MRKIIREELLKIRVSENRGDSHPFENHPFFGNPEKIYNYAMEWVEKTNQLKHFHQLVGNVLWNTDLPDAKIEALKLLYKEYSRI